MKILTALLFSCLTGFFGYWVGYKQGGEDFAFMDHMMMGMLANASIDRCEKSESPRECYRWDKDLQVGHAFTFYLHHRNDLSPIAEHAFPDSYGGYLKSVSALHELASSKGAENLCSHIAEIGREEMEECMSEVSRFEALASKHINKKLEPTADAPAE